MDSYTVTTEPVMRVQDNANGKTIGEFQRYRKHIRWSYDKLSAANNTAICAALKTGVAGAVAPVAVTYWDSDTSAFLTGNFIALPTAPVFHRMAGAAVYRNVTFEIVEQ
jgi:hypothetical protein